MNLPPLPKIQRLVDIPGYTVHQMQAYGKACRATALEEAAGVIEADIYPAPLTAYQVQYNAGISLRVSKIRSLK